jgi:hypothetical protein
VFLPALYRRLFEAAAWLKPCADAARKFWPTRTASEHAADIRSKTGCCRCSTSRTRSTSALRRRPRRRRATRSYHRKCGHRRPLRLRRPRRVQILEMKRAASQCPGGSGAGLGRSRQDLPGARLLPLAWTKQAASTARCGSIVVRDVRSAATRWVQEKPAAVLCALVLRRKVGWVPTTSRSLFGRGVFRKVDPALAVIT